MSLQRMASDPSEELMKLIGELQRMPPPKGFDPIPVPGKLYSEAHNWSVLKGHVPVSQPNVRCINMMFCGQWITPTA